MENQNGEYSELFKGLNTGDLAGEKIVLNYNTAFESAFTFILSACIIIFLAVIFTDTPGMLTGNPVPYFFYGSLLLAGIFIRFNFSCYTVIDSITSRLIFVRNLFSNVYQPEIIQFSEISFVTISGFPSKSSGILNDYLMVLILKDGKIVKMGNPVWLRDVPGNKPAVMALAALFKCDFIEPVADKSIVVLSRPVLIKESIGYTEIRRGNKRAYFIILAVAFIIAVAAILVSFFLKRY